MVAGTPLQGSLIPPARPPRRAGGAGAGSSSPRVPSAPSSLPSSSPVSSSPVGAAERSYAEEPGPSSTSPRVHVGGTTTRSTARSTASRWSCNPSASANASSTPSPATRPRSSPTASCARAASPARRTTRSRSRRTSTAARSPRPSPNGRSAARSPSPTGLTVDHVVADSPAATVLRPGDLITAVDGRPSRRRPISPTPSRGHRPARDVAGPAADGHSQRSHDARRRRRRPHAGARRPRRPPTSTSSSMPVTVDATASRALRGADDRPRRLRPAVAPTSPPAAGSPARARSTSTATSARSAASRPRPAPRRRPARELFLAPANQAADAREVLGTRIPVIGVDDVPTRA